MKKFLYLSGLLCVLSNSANATGIYVGLDALSSNANFTAKNISSVTGPKNNSEKQDSKFNAGINAGVRFDLLTFYASGELFFDNLQSSTQNLSQISGSNSGGDITLKNRYGVKGNIGFAILPRVTPFITYGLANVSYSNSVANVNQSTSQTELAPLYGVGVLVDLPFNVSVKASYDYQRFNMRYASGASKIKTDLGIAKLGVIYNF